jgi:hypothetical protein
MVAYWSVGKTSNQREGHSLGSCPVSAMPGLGMADQRGRVHGFWGEVCGLRVLQITASEATFAAQGQWSILTSEAALQPTKAQYSGSHNTRARLIMRSVCEWFLLCGEDCSRVFLPKIPFPFLLSHIFQAYCIHIHTITWYRSYPYRGVSIVG